MKKLKLILFSAIISSLFFASCTELNSDELPGSDITNGGNAPIIIGWGKPAVTESYFTDLGVLNNTYPINILGGGDGSPSTSDITITLSIDTENSTAVEGNEFTFPSTSVKIPAGSIIGLVPINVNTAAFSATNPTQVTINAVTTSEGVVVSSAAKKLVMNFVGCKSLLASYTYEMTVTSSTGNVYGPVIETIREESVNSFSTYSVGTWGSTPFNIGNGIEFSDICGTLTMPLVQDLADYYGNEVTPRGTATVDENGNFTLKYTIGFNAGPVDYTAVFTKQ
jgi:hypothetical protein